MKTKQLLKEALTSLPLEFAFRDVRFYVNQAIAKLEAVEKKKEKKIQHKEEQKVTYSPQSLITLESMIQEEKEKLAKILEKKIKQNDEIQAILG